MQRIGIPLVKEPDRSDAATRCWNVQGSACSGATVKTSGWRVPRRKDIPF